jgi:hypothetical protein
VRIAPDLRRSEYRDVDEKLIRHPVDPAHEPSRAALAEHNAACTWLT